MSNKLIRFAVNTHVQNKTKDWHALTTKYQDKTGTLEDVKSHIKAGHALCAGLLGGKNRATANVIGSQWVMMDIDNSEPLLDADGNKVLDGNGRSIPHYVPRLTLEAAREHPFIQRHCALIYTSPSHRPDWHKLRLVFLLPEFESDTDLIEAQIQLVAEEFAESHDPNVKDAGRVWFGNTNAEFPLFNPDAVLPGDWRQRAIALAEKQKQAEAKKKADQEAKRKLREQQIKDGQIAAQDTDALVQEALSCIPQRSPGTGNHKECTTVAMALFSHYGEVEGARICEQWSPSLKKGGWNVSRIMAGFARTNGASRVTIGSLFHLAKYYGFRFPVRPHVESYRESQPTISKEEWLKKYSGGGKQGEATISALCSPLVNWVKKRLAATPWGLGEKQQTAFDAGEGLKVQYYQRGERLAVWEKLVAQGCRHILDTSGTGRGKSHDAGRCVPETLGAKKLFYASENHRNPTTPTLRENFVDCDPRHDGLYRDEQGNLRRHGKEGEGYVVPPNCGRVETSAALRDKQIDGADETSLLCQTCPALEGCRKGAIFGYIRQRSEALAEDRIRIHPQSLPPVHDKDGNIDYDYSEDVLLHDEVGQFFKTFRAFSVGVFDVQRTIADVLMAAPEQFKSLQNLLATLLKYLKGEIPQTNKYGWNHAASVLALREDVSVETIAAVRAALEVDLRERLSTTDRYGVALADLPGAMRGKFSDSDRTAAEKIRAEVALQWLPEVLEILAGITAGALQICGGKLTVTVADYRYREVVEHAKANIYLDATLTPERLAQMIGCDVDEIAHIQEYQPDADNLELTQVMGLGRLGISGRSEFLQKRVDAVVDELRGTLEGKTAAIDFKRYQTGEQNAYAWFRDSRGSNDLQDVVNLVLVGTPCQNLAALEAEYICITGRVPAAGRVTKTFSVQVPGRENDSQEPKFTCEVSEDEDFADFCHQRIIANIIQGIGRLRADRRPGEKLRVYFLGDYPLPMPVMLKRAVDITPEAADKVERLVKAIEDAKVWLKKHGQKETYRAIARIVGIDHARVFRLLKMLTSTTSNSNSESQQNMRLPSEGSVAHDLGTVYFPLLAQEAPEHQVEGLLNAFVAHGSRIMSQAWSFLSAQASIQLQTGLLLALPEADFNELSAIA